MWEKVLTSIAAPIAGEIVGGAIGAWGAERANVASARSAQKRMDFEERMYKTRYQMQVKDLRAAGLNPALAYMQSPGGAPSGAQYTAANVGAPLGAAASRGVSSAIASRRVKAEVDAMVSAAAKNREETITTKKLGDRMDAEKSKILKENLILDEGLSSAKAAATRARQDQTILNSGWGRAARWMGTIMRESGLSSPRVHVGAGFGNVRGHWKRPGYEPQSPKEAWKRRPRRNQR